MRRVWYTWLVHVTVSVAAALDDGDGDLVHDVVDFLLKPLENLNVDEESNFVEILKDESGAERLSLVEVQQQLLHRRVLALDEHALHDVHHPVRLLLVVGLEVVEEDDEQEESDAQEVGG